MNEHLTMVMERPAPGPVAPEIPAVAVPPVGTEKSPARPAQDRATLAGSVLLVVVGLAVIGSWARLKTPESAPVAAGASTPAISTNEARPLVQYFDGTHPIKRGDLIVFQVSSSPETKPVLATANETLVVRRGQAIESLFIMGPRSYLVDSADDPKVVRVGKIRGTLAGSEKPAP